MVGPTLRRVEYECASGERPPTPQLEVRRTPPPVARAASARPAPEGPKVAAWTKAKAATDAWALCLQFDAERKAGETTKVPQLVAQEVVDACSQLEHKVHEPLEAVGEDSTRFQEDLHAQAVQNARDTVTRVRMKASTPVAGPLPF